MTSNNYDIPNNKKGFPMELLFQPIQKRLEYFQSVKLKHPILEETVDKLWEAINSNFSNSIILVYGPTGVGKTTILEHLMNKILNETKNDLITDREKIPYVKVEVAGTNSGKFDWKDFYRDILQGLAEFSIDHRVNLLEWESPHQPYLPLENIRQSYQLLANNVRSTESRLRNSVEQALRHRRPSVVLLDEAQHLTALSSGRKLLDQQNVIKSLANKTNTKHALFGSYELMMLRDLNGQLARRTINIHFRRYSLSLADREAFRNSVISFEGALPLKEQSFLADYEEFLYQGCLGCIGILKDWLYRALLMALNNQEETIALNHLENTKLDNVKLLKILEECLNGERQLKDEESESPKELRRLLGLDLLYNDEVRSIKNNHRTYRKVGERNPIRDSIEEKIRSIA
jgi:energy-coupling factor transporter ATP-binding protein EcfA2